MADLSAAESAIQGAVVEDTNKKQSRAWNRYNSYLLSIGCQADPFLEQFSRAQCHRILAAYAHAIREGRLSSGPHKILKSESVRTSLDHVAQAFKLADHPDPRLDRDGKCAFFLQRQLQYYSNNDKPE